MRTPFRPVPPPALPVVPPTPAPELSKPPVFPESKKHLPRVTFKGVDDFSDDHTDENEGAVFRTCSQPSIPMARRHLTVCETMTITRDPLSPPSLSLPISLMTARSEFHIPQHARPSHARPFSRKSKNRTKTTVIFPQLTEPNLFSSSYQCARSQPIAVPKRSIPHSTSEDLRSFCPPHLLARMHRATDDLAFSYNSYRRWEPAGNNM